MKHLPAILAVLALAHTAIAQQSKDLSRPNVVIFITDDESWLERSAYGWSKIPTPHFDRVAREGVLFTHGYTSAPSCAPSRASLLTGRNFWELDQGAFIQAWLPDKFAVLPDLMEKGGYHAGYTGKGWGPGVLPRSGRTRNPAGDAFNSVKNPTKETGINPLDYAGNFEAFLETCPPEKPFCFWVGCTEPHAPYDRDNYKKLDNYGFSSDQVQVPGFLPDTPGIRRARANFLYEVAHVDQDLGKVLQVLQRRGELANTLLIVTADNGTACLRSKTNVYDWGVRVPLAVMWPARVKPGRRVDDFVNFIDLAPTILQAAGLPVPDPMSGRSLLDVLTSEASGRVDPDRSWTAAGLEWHGEFEPVNLAARMIRDQRYQYIVNYGTGPRIVLDPARRLSDELFAQSAETDGETELLQKHPDHPALRPFIPLLAAARPREELYDCQADPWELRNLADSPEHAAVKKRLRNQLEAYQQKTGDPRMTGNMAVFDKTRDFVQERKRDGYQNGAEQ
ncbi:MAG: sulfatase family protein [Thermoguttaceae bacterium]